MADEFELDLDDFQPTQELQQESKNQIMRHFNPVLLQKIEDLQAVLIQLVSGPEKHQSQVEKLIDQLLADANGFLNQSQNGSKPVIGAPELSNYSSSFLNVNSSSSAFDLESFPDIFQEPQFKTEDNCSADEFISFLMNDEQQQDQVLKLEVDEEMEADRDALPPGSYDLIELDAMEILAEHTHFCDLCGKGFKRDANLRMHMRGHGDEYKSPAALAKPRDPDHDAAQESNPNLESDLNRVKRYSCPFAGCKRHKLHPKFLPLKTVLCVKNHYRRSHCPKMLTCSKCQSKKFSVMADLRTHEKHCGREKWRCSCGTTFSRKEKLLGHVSLFSFGHRALAPKYNIKC